MPLRLQFCDVDEKPHGPCHEKYEVLPDPQPELLPVPQPPPVPPAPVVVDERLSVLPEQSTLLDVAALMAGIAFTVTVPHDLQPFIVYVIFAVPALVPLTTPEVLIVAINVLLLLHVPPAIAATSVSVLPAHKVAP